MRNDMTRLGDLCEFRYGKSLPAQRRREGPIPVYGSNGVVGSHDEAITNGKTIIIGRKGSIGEINISADSCWPIDTTYYIDSDATEVDIHWLSGALSGLGLQKLNKAAAVPGLNRGDAYEKKLFVPRIGEQRRIAAILDKADALRRKRRRALDLLDGLTQSIFVEMFGDPASNQKVFSQGVVGDLLAETQYGISRKAGLAGAFPILRMGNVTNDGRILVDDLKFIDIPERELQKFTVQKGDIIFNRTNSADLVGKTAVFERDEVFAFAGYLIRARTKAGFSPNYVSGYLNSSHGKTTLRKMAKSIVGMANINAKEMASIPILIPDQASQKRYDATLSEIRRRRSRFEDQSSRLDALFTSLQSRAFSGQL